MDCLNAYTQISCLANTKSSARASQQTVQVSHPAPVTRASGDDAATRASGDQDDVRIMLRLVRVAMMQRLVRVAMM